MGLVYPKKCILCGKPLPAVDGDKSMICPACAADVQEKYRCTQELFVPCADGTAAALLYKDSVAAAMRGFKFHHKQHYADWFAAQTTPILAAHLDDWRPEVITYAPIGLFRWYQRGYNQSELLAKAVAKPFGLPCTATLRKRFFTGKQSKRKNAEDRWHNAAHAFLPRSSVDLIGKSVVFIDDIITTGATASAAAEVLRSMGAERVFILAPTATPY